SYNHERPSCLLLDVRMPAMSGLELQEELNKRDIDIPIIFISGHAEVSDSAKAFRAGAIDFLEKPFEYSVLLERIEEGIDKDIYARKQRSMKQEIQKRLAQLSTREMDVLRLIISSHSNKESAKILNVSNRTIDAHRARIMEKLQADSLTELMKIAMQCDLL
ncbi:MAG: response regulator, partial [Methylococcaceae bacterium]|nr:response regulator [Methylococcaceae bacterium]